MRYDLVLNFKPNIIVWQFISLSWLTCQKTIPDCPIVQPTDAEFQNFGKFVQSLKKQYEKSYGMVIPPKSWKPRQIAYSQSLANLIIKNPIEQNPEGKMGIYEFKHIGMPSISYSEFIEQNQNKESVVKGLQPEQVQTLFWKNVAYSAPIYGADLLGTLMQPCAGSWHLNKLDTILQKGLQKNLRGVNTSYCYIGSWKSLFCWHKEDLDLDAINYLHFGKSKFWYCIQQQDSHYLEKQAKRAFFEGFDNCPQYLRHKTCLINPYAIKKLYPRLRIVKMQQRPNQFIIAFSGAYHCGFNFGINVAEAVNFATLDWLQKINQAKHCQCRKSSVKIAAGSVIDRLLQTQEYKDNPFILRLKNEQQKQNSQENVQYQQKTQRQVSKYEQKNLRKTKKIEKKPKKQQKPTKKSSSKARTIKVEYIQCNLCQSWLELSPQKANLANEQTFYCSSLGKQCQMHPENAERPAQNFQDNQELPWLQ